ncbi:clumping factor A-like [Dermacentor silvarum]|uniref:clumping factor A-like n=1 Tax=Dermacentor silvarum TaxID=543639 RepID=UPI001898B5AA|nr:clumping factor A-like [Dermacentor silvarum]
MRAAAPLLLLCMATLAAGEEGKGFLVFVTERKHERCFPFPFLGYFICVESTNIDMFIPSGNNTGQDSNSTSDSSPPTLDTTSDGDSESPTAPDDSTSVDDSSEEGTPSETQETTDSDASSPSQSGQEGSPEMSTTTK